MNQDHRPFPPPPDWLMHIMRIFNEHSFQCYMVGGAVRDQIRRQPVYDYDLATDATPNEMKKLWRRIVSTGAKYGTMTLLSGKNHAEVTTFRSEGQYRNSRHPEQVSFGTDITTDLSRRDFTINAIAYDPLTNRLIDPFGGAEDIERQIIRTVGAPQQRLTEDALRVLRAVRFATTLGFTIETETEQALIACANGVRAVSAERIREELERIVVSPRCVAGFAHLARLQLLPIIFATERVAARLTQQDTDRQETDRQETDKLNPQITRYLEIAATIIIERERSRTATTANTDTDTDTAQSRQSRLRHTLLWYALLRCGEEPPAADQNTDHEPPAERETTQTLLLARIATQLTALRYSRAHQESVVHLVRMLTQLPTLHCPDSDIRYFFFTVGRQYMSDIQQLIAAIEHGDEPALKNNAVARLRSMANQQQVFSYRDLAIDGNDLQQIGYQRGKIIGAFMQHAIRYVCAHPERNTRQHLTEQAHIWQSHALLHPNRYR